MKTVLVFLMGIVALVGTICTAVQPELELRLQVNPHSVVLTWTPSVITAGVTVTGYAALRGPCGGPWTVSVPVSGNVTTTTDTSVVAGQTYGYVVQATSANGNSVNSNEFCGTIPNPATGTVQTVFIIMEENNNLSSLNLTNAPYIIGTLVPSGASATQYFNPPANHPSEPNYVWLEAADNEGLITDNDPTPTNSSATIQHLATYLSNAGISWRGYAENITGTVCPLSTVGNYYPKHVPFIFFQDQTNNESPTSPTCIAGMRPYTQLATDLANGTTARYNFITPNGADDMHDTGITAGDTWLSQNVPAILASNAFKNNGALFIMMDEAGTGDGPIPFIAISPLAKVNYQNAIHYDHSSTVLTLQEIFGTGPCLRNACTATDLSDLFQAGTITPLPAAVPTVSLTLSVPSISPGGNAVLTLASTNATSCTGRLTGVLNGSVTVAPGATTTYSETCTGTGGSATAKATLTVSPETATFTPPAYPLTLGRTTTVTFTLTGQVAKTCTASLRVTPAGVVTVSALSCH